MSHTRKSSRREMTDDSDEDSVKVVSKHSHHSDIKKVKEKHKKSKKSSRHRSQSSSDSGSEYNSKKENDIGKKHKQKKHSKQNEKQSSESYDALEVFRKLKSDRIRKSILENERDIENYKKRKNKESRGKNISEEDEEKHDSSPNERQLKNDRIRKNVLENKKDNHKKRRHKDSTESDSSEGDNEKYSSPNDRRHKSGMLQRRKLEYDRDNKNHKKRRHKENPESDSDEEEKEKYDSSSNERKCKFDTIRKPLSENERDKHKKKRHKDIQEGDSMEEENEKQDSRASERRHKKIRDRTEKDKRHSERKKDKTQREMQEERVYERNTERYEPNRKSRDLSKERENFRKRSRSRDRQRYGKWNEESASAKDSSHFSLNNDEDIADRDNNESETQRNIRHDSPDGSRAEEEIKVDDSVEPLSKRSKMGNINLRSGGAYIPPARLKMMQESIEDKGSDEYQRIAWEALKKSIIGMTNKVNASNIGEIIQELFKENIIRGRGILTRAVMQAQAASPTFTRVYAALVAVINSKFPEIGELILKRLSIQYKRGFRRNDKTVCMNAVRFLAHLLNQEVVHEILLLEVVTHLLENPTEDSIEIAIAALKECGKKLTQLTSRGMRAITQRVRDVLHEGNVDMRVRYMIEVFFAVQKDGYKDFEIITEDLDLLEEEDKFTHLLNLDDAIDAQDILNVYKFDPDYQENEEKYKSVAKEILGESDDEGKESGDESNSESDEEDEKNIENQEILDQTETNIVCLRRKIYLTIQSSLDFEECAHKLLKLELKPGQIMEMCYMILDCCAQQRTYEKFYGLLAQRFCQLNKIYVDPFTEIFQNSYTTIHRLETNKLRNVAKFFAHQLYTDAISWNVLSIIKLNEEDTTSSSRIFIKILFQELCEYMGLPKLNDRVKDVTLQEAFEGLFPRDDPHNTRFAINFFTSIGLGGLTDELREHLKNVPKTPIIPVVAQEKPSSSSSSTSSSSSDTSSSSSSSSSSDSD